MTQGLTAEGSALSLPLGVVSRSRLLEWEPQVPCGAAHSVADAPSEWVSGSQSLYKKESGKQVPGPARAQAGGRGEGGESH